MRWRKLEDITELNPNHVGKDFVIKEKLPTGNDINYFVKGSDIRIMLRHKDIWRDKDILICRVTDRPRKTDGLKGEV